MRLCSRSSHLDYTAVPVDQRWLEAFEFAWAHGSPRCQEFLRPKSLAEFLRVEPRRCHPHVGRPLGELVLLVELVEFGRLFPGVIFGLEAFPCPPRRSG